MEILINKDEISYLEEAEELLNKKITQNEYYISVEQMIGLIEDLVIELSEVKEKFDDLQEKVEEIGLKEVNPYTERGISERDFY